MGKVRSFILGGVIGALAALAFAPQSGEQTRTIVIEKVGSLKDDVQGKAGNLMGNAAGSANDASADELREKIEAARKRIAEQVAKDAEAAAATE